MQGLLENFLEYSAGIIWNVGMETAFLIPIIWICDRLLRKKSSLFRYWLWMIVIFRLCIPFDINLPETIDGFFIRKTTNIIPEIRLTKTYRAVSYETGKVISLFAGDSTKEESLKTLDPATEYSPKITINLYALGWFSFAALLLFLMFMHILYINRLFRRSLPVDELSLQRMVGNLARGMGIGRTVRLYRFTSGGYAVPAAFGIFRPRIFFPRAMLDEWTTAELKPVILHELAHIRRYDIIFNWIQILVQIVYFFNPLVLLVNRRIRDLREEICDDIAVHGMGNNSLAYSKSILRVMESITERQSFCSVGLGLSKRRSSIGNRIRRIMNNDYRVSVRLPAGSIAALCIIGLSGIVFAGAQTEMNRPAETNDTASAYHETDPETAAIVLARGKYFKPNEDFKWSLLNLVDAVNGYTTIQAEAVATIGLDDAGILQSPYLYIAADRAFELTREEALNLGNYLRNGGFAFIDNTADAGYFDETVASIRHMLKDSIGKDMIILPLEDDHPVHFCFFDFMGAPGGMDRGIDWTKKQNKQSLALLNVDHKLEGIWIGERLAGIYSNKGYSYRWTEPMVSGPQIKFGVNTVIFALTQEGGLFKQRFDSGNMESSGRSMNEKPENAPEVVLNLSSPVKMGTERVIVNGIRLIRGIDYRIEHAVGKIILKNEEAIHPRADIQVRFHEAGKEPQSIDINIFNTGDIRPETKGNLLSLNARVGYEDGSSVYYLNFSEKASIKGN